MRPSRRMTMLAAALVALLAGAPGTGLGQQADLWARIDGARIEIQPGATVAVCGSGHLAFVDGRRTIEALPGAAIRVAEGTGKVVRGDVAIEIRGPGSHRWVVRRAPGLPAAGGTTIRDPDDGGRASIDAAEPTRFWLAVGEGDETVFFQPEEDAAACDEAATTGGHPDSAAAAIDRTLDRLAGYGFSGAVLVARGGEPILAAGYGLADRERGIPVRPQTIFELGSLTKQFTATAVLLLAERGELSLDDSLGATWDLPPPVAEITLHQLLTHTSGLPEDFPDPAPSSPAAVVDRLRGIELAAEPGTEFDYSNLGYVVLAALLEERTGTPYAALLESLLFAPLDLEGIGIYRPGAWPDSLLAVGYSGTFGSGQALDPHPVRAVDWDLLGASGVVASLPALHRWVRALMEGEVLSADSMRRMLTPWAEEFGYGWIVFETERETGGIIHGGDTKGVQSYAGIYPDEDLVVLLAVNDRRGWRGPVYSLLVDLALGAEPPPLPPPTMAVDAAELESWSGTYRLPDGAEIHARPFGDGLLLGAEGQSAVSLITSPSAEERSALAESSAAAETFMAALAEGDSAAVREALAPSGRAESFFDLVWSALTEGHGPLAGYEVLGTAPDRAGRRITFVRLAFPDGEETLRLVWRPHLDGWGTGGTRPQREFRPVGPAEFATYDLFAGTTIRIRFHAEDGRRAIEFLDAPRAPRAVSR